MNEIKDEIEKNRPSLSESSVKTYCSILKNLYKQLYPEDKEVDVKKFDDHKVVLDHLKDQPVNKRKTILSALFVISKNDKYHDLMLNDGHKYNAEQQNQEMTESQKENWLSQDQINDTINMYAKNVKKLNEKTTLSVKEFQHYQDYIILCLMTGKYLPPRRLKDWTEMKIKNTTENDNIIDLTSGKKKRKTYDFVFNNYKTAKFYGAQRVPIPKELNLILEQFMSKCPTDWLLCDSHNSKLTPIKLNQRLNKIFGKKVSCNILRHSFLSDKYKDIPALKEMNDIAKEMGHSLNEALLYVKKDAPDTHTDKPAIVEPPFMPAINIETNKKKKTVKVRAEKKNYLDV
jgi:hypothetical protein